MISSVKKLFTFVIGLCLPIVGYGKEVGCYKMIESSDSNIKIGVIQFISFIGDQCYESDNGGVSVKNGTMQKNVYQSNLNRTIYNGGCFCGNGAKFEFSSDKQTLVVTSKSGYKYKLKKIVVPSGVTTCSIIREHDGGSIYVDNNYNGYNNSNNLIQTPLNLNSSSSGTSRNDGNRYDNSPSKRRCVYCNGMGQITKNDNAPANFGIEKPRRRCSTCGEWYNPNVFNHYHIRCSHCGGAGFAK